MTENISLKVKKNIIFGLVSQLLIMAVSIILPRLIISSYGSDLNGVTVAITQVFTYISLLQAGIGNASLNLLYKNIADESKEGISTTISATKAYFRGMVPFYIIAVVIFCIVYPLITNTTASESLLRAVIVIQGVGALVDFYFSNTFTQLLLADGKNYVVANLNMLVKVFSSISQILLIYFGFSIVVIQGSYAVLYIIKALLLNYYIEKNYPWLRVSANGDKSILKQRKAFMVHEISNVIFQSTDIFMITTFCSGALASVYSVYQIVYTAINSFVSIFYKGIDFILGQVFNRGIEGYKKIHDAYETLYMAMFFSFTTVACILTIPFVKIYTEGIVDVDYIDYQFPFLFALIQVLSCSRAVSAKLIAISGHAKNTQVNTAIEAVINLVASLIFVQIWGIHGVLYGTIVALLYRTNDIIIYANIKILKRKPSNTYKNMLIDMGLMLLFLTVFHSVSIKDIGLAEFFAWGVLLSTIVFGSFFLAAVSLNRDVISLIKRLVKK